VERERAAKEKQKKKAKKEAAKRKADADREHRNSLLDEESNKPDKSPLL
jgi:hypothetical protein